MPTALELPRAQWKPYIEAARQRPAMPALTPAERQAREQVLERVRKATALLKQRFGVRRTILFGSLAHMAWFRTDSDVDLAVEGLPVDAYWKAWQLLEEFITDRSVDLIEIESAGESLQTAIQRYGIEL